jgi:potassium-transporting ATPase KdpC subunit
MRNHLLTSLLMTAVTTILLGLIYPLVVTGISQVLFREKANGQLIVRNGVVIGSRIIAQPFTGGAYFHPRPSAAGTGYDGTSSGGTNLGPTNQKLIDRVKQDVESARAENSAKAIPIDMVTTSASGLDPEITPANADFQITRVARERGLSESEVRTLVHQYTKGRELGFLGEPRINVLELNLELDRLHPVGRQPR